MILFCTCANRRLRNSRSESVPQRRFRSMQKLANWPLFLVKILGIVLSVSSCLSVGQEGPLIHIGAIMGASCTKIGGIRCPICSFVEMHDAIRGRGIIIGANLSPRSISSIRNCRGPRTCCTTAWTSYRTSPPPPSDATW